MDFFASQDQARKKTGQLVVLFVAAVVLIVAAIYFAATGMLYLMAQNDPKALKAFTLWSPIRALISTAFTLLIVASGSFFQIIQLARGGGKYVAAVMGGRPIPPNSRKPRERKLLNVVEEMALASGAPMPPVYVLDQEQGINAFAAGYHPSDAVIAVSRGSLERLTRSELQGVIAHEYSHILNGDMRLNIRLMGVLHGILLLALMGGLLLRSVRFMRGNRKKGGFVAVIALSGLTLFVVGWIGVFFGKLIKSAVSRQREFLADASAVQFTRDPNGLAGALKKIGGFPIGSRIQSPRAEQMSHMFFCNALRSCIGGLLATHPPLTTRIQRVDPQFTGTYPKTEIVDETVDAVAGFAGAAPPPPVRKPIRAIEPGKEKHRGIDPQSIIQKVGAPLQEHLDKAREMLDALPHDLLESARDPFGARALIYALLLSSDDAVRRKQWVQLQAHADAIVYGETQKLTLWVDGLDSLLRLPLADLSMAALKQMSDEQYRIFKDNVDKLIAADEMINLFEYSLTHSLSRNLGASFDKPAIRRTQVYAARSVEQEIACVLSVLARFGHTDEEQAQQAFDSAGRLLYNLKCEVRFLSERDCSLAKFSRALDKLAVASINIRKWIITACLQSLAFDGKVSEEEAELFRSISYALDCPVPVWT